MADSENHDDKVSEFCNLSGATPEQANQFLEAHGWDMTAACNSFFQDQEAEDQETRAQPPPATEDSTYTGPRTLDGRPAPGGASSSRSAGRPAPQAKRKGIATLGSLGSGGGPSNQGNNDDDDDDDDNDDEDDDGRGNLFAGGEKSGLAVQDPQKEGPGSKKIINDILAKAKAQVISHSNCVGQLSLTGPSNSERPEAATAAGASAPNRFRGTGMTLGGDGVESRSIPDPLGASRAPSGPPQERVLHLWQDGFSIDDGELRRFDDPANQVDLAMIRSGRAPLHLMNVQHDQPVDVKLQQHEENYKAPPKKYKPFSGSGQRLGAVVPGDSEGDSAGVSAPEAASAPSTSAPAAPAVDSSQPTLTIRIQMPDGTRLPARFNPTHTLGDVYGFVQSASTEVSGRPWVLATTFPNKDHTDKSLVLGEMAEFKKGGTAMVKWA